MVYQPIKRSITDVGPSPLTIFRENTDLEVSDTTTETEVLSYTIPANTLTGDRGLRVTLREATYQDSGGFVDYTWRIKLGATTLHTTGALSVPDGGAAWKAGTLVFEVFAKNSDAVQEMFSSHYIAAAGYGTMGEQSGSATEDATTDLDLVVTIEMGTAHADARFARRKYLIELI